MGLIGFGLMWEIPSLKEKRRKILIGNELGISQNSFHKKKRKKKNLHPEMKESIRNIPEFLP